MAKFSWQYIGTNGRNDLHISFVLRRKTHNDWRGKKSGYVYYYYIFKMPAVFIHFSTLQATVRHRVFGEAVLRTTLCAGTLGNETYVSNGWIQIATASVRVIDMPNGTATVGVSKLFMEYSIRLLSFIVVDTFYMNRICDFVALIPQNGNNGIDATSSNTSTTTAVSFKWTFVDQ